MISWVLFKVSTLAALIILASFAMFAIEQAKEGSERQQASIANVNQPDPAPRTENQREQRHSGVRELIDDANDYLTKPFATVTDSNDIWVQRAVPTLLAFLLFAMGLRIVASYARRLP
jgi:hypothetical protein